MKRHHLLVLPALFCLIFQNSFCQNNTGFESKSIPSSILQISDQLTTHLIFPQAIKSVDRGNRNILVQKAKEVENILQVKAENSDLPNSNLTVITADGSFYSFEVGYQKNPSIINLSVLPVGNKMNRTAFIEPSPPKSEIEETARLISLKHRSMPAIRQRKFMTGFSLTGIYIENDLLYFQLQLENLTNIPYDTEQFRLFIKDNKQSKRSASQELEQVPLLIWGNHQRIPEHSTQTLVLALEKFTLPNQKHLQIELMEKKGGRNLKIKVKNRHLMDAMALE